MDPKQAAIAAVAGVGLAWAMSKAADKAAEASDTGTTALDYANPFGLVTMQLQAATVDNSVQDGNVRAFLEAIAWAEGTARQADPYRVCYAYRHTIADLSEHPAITGEWKGERLTDQQCKGAGFGPGCVSTAAGKYQINKPTWMEARRALKLQDFSPDSQDRAAVWIIDAKCKALGAVQAGDVTEAARLCRGRWASLPGANYAGQGMRSEADLIAAFEQAGGYRA